MSGLLALLWLAAPASQPTSQPASTPITRETRPDLFSDEPPARIEPVTPAQEPQESPAAFWTKMLVRTVVVLAAVVLLAYLLLNKGMGKLMKLTGAGGNKSITVLERTALSQKHAIYIIEVQGRRFLIGTGDNSIANLGELRDELPTSVMTKEHA